MCMFCVIQKWSRRVATMLPWLVIPLIGLWALSQLLPPAFRFEITSPRLACVFVLLVTLFWYEVLMPQLSAWRLRRNARLRERKRFEAQELLKLKKTATRKCRNCSTPYRDQNPGGGKFMCSYCGHVSKRPVLDLPVPPGMGISNNGIIKDLFGKGGKMFNGKAWLDNVSICNQEWMENGSWVVNGSFPMKPGYPPRRSGVGFFGGSEPCLGEKSYSGAFFFACKLLNLFFSSIRWLWRKLGFSSSREDSSFYADHRGKLTKKGENGYTGPESRGDRARRKAEEKRQARLVKELLEEEERKQREEVAKLVEERQRLRHEKIEAENRAKGTCSLREKDSKKEAEKRQQERKKEKDKGSSKSNSDVEELEKKVVKETERRRDTEKKCEADQRESLKTGLDSVKGHNVESGLGLKHSSANHHSQGHVATRYFDRVRGTFLSSSKAFTGSSFFGKVTSAPAPASKEVKHGSSVDYSFFSDGKRDANPPDHLPVKAIMNGDDKSHIRSVSSDTQRKTAPKSWQQLFTRSPTVPASATSHSNVISRPSAKSQVEVQSPQPPCSGSSAQLYDNPINLPSPFVLPSFSNRPVANSSSLPAVKEAIFPSIAETPQDFLPEEPELFEDPCYEPDPVSLLGPVSESLDNFHLDLGSSYILDEQGKFGHLLNVSSPLDVSRPPIESSLSRQRAAVEKQSCANLFPSSPKGMDMYSFPLTGVNNISDNGAWHMWNSSPLGPDGLSLVGGPASWVTPLEQSTLHNEAIVHYSPHKTMASLFTKDENITSGAHSSQKILSGNAQTCPSGLSTANSNDQDPWLQNASFPPLLGGEGHMPTSPSKEDSHKQMVYGSPSRSATNQGFDPSATNYKNEWAVQGSGEGIRNPSLVKPPIGGLYSPADVQSLWSIE